MSIAGDADRYSELDVELLCPICGSAGLIPLQHLDRAIYCRQCSIAFRVEANRLVAVEESARERISVQVRSSSSEWHDHKAIIEKAVPLVVRMRNCVRGVAISQRARWVAGLGAILVTIATIMTATREPDRPSAKELPTSLEERVLLLADALVRRDMSVLIALTDPTQHRALRIWLAHGADLPKQLASVDVATECKLIDQAKTTAAGDNLEVRVRVRGADIPQDYVLKQRWVRQGETWYFRPVRLRSALPPSSPTKIKQRMRASG